MISEQEIEEAVDFLHRNSNEAARVRAERMYCEEFRKSLKAILMGEHLGQAVNAQEREAYAHPRYLEHLGEMKKAVFEDEKNRALRSSAEIKIEAWRTQQANVRAVKL